MEPLEDSKSQTARTFDGFYRTTGKKTKMAGFRIYQEQADKLKSDYEGNTSVLVRLLLEQYFNGELPEVETKYKQLVGE